MSNTVDSKDVFIAHGHAIGLGLASIGKLLVSKNVATENEVIGALKSALETALHTKGPFAAEPLVNALEATNKDWQSIQLT